jgi:SAM-dependent methyltransferase
MLELRAIPGKAAVHMQSTVSRAENRVFDHLMGVSTRHAVYAKDSLVTTGGDNLGYESCGWRSVRRVLTDLRPGPRDTFVDVGCGKGRALLIAGQLPFRQVTGVEIDEELSRYGRENIERARPHLRAPDIGIVTANVLDWAIPDDASVFFFYNPFIAATFRAVIGRILESHDRKPRVLHLVYAVPWEHNWLLSTGRFAVDNVRPGRWPAFRSWWKQGNVIVSYRVTGPAADSPEPQSLSRVHRQAFRMWSSPNDFRFSVGQPGYPTVFSDAPDAVPGTRASSPGAGREARTTTNS